MEENVEDCTQFIVLNPDDIESDEENNLTENIKPDRDSTYTAEQIIDWDLEIPPDQIKKEILEDFTAEPNHQQDFDGLASESEDKDYCCVVKYEGEQLIVTIGSDDEDDDVPVKKVKENKQVTEEDSEEDKYHCDTCGLGFTHFFALKRHAASHAGKRIYSCHICNHEFIKRWNVYRHMKKVHNITVTKNMMQKRYKKPQKKSRSKDGGYVYKELVGTDIADSPVAKLSTKSMYKCNKCGDKFEHFIAFKRHMAKHAGKPIFVCPVCDDEFLKKFILQRHLKNQHGLPDHDIKTMDYDLLLLKDVKFVEPEKEVDDGSAEDLIPELTVETAEESSEEPFYWKCNQCDKAYVTADDLKNHLQEHAQGGRPVYECEECLKPFKLQSQLLKHKCVLEKPKQDRVTKLMNTYLCDLCGEVFYSCLKRDQHYHEHGNGLEKVFKCTVCLNAFATYKSLKRHMFVHSETEEKPFKCKHCGKTYLHEKSLSMHMKIHTGGMIYQCHICPSSFVNATNLKRHIFCHSGERPFQCEICKKTFKTSSHLKNHMAMHAQIYSFKCPDCTKAFATYKQLIYHRNCAHLKETTYECDICFKIYYNPINLRSHKKMHEEPTFHCDKCDKSYLHRYQLQRHVLTHDTPIKPTHPTPHESFTHPTHQDPFNLPTH